MKRLNVSKYHKENMIFINVIRNMFLVVIIPYVILCCVYYNLNSKIKVQTYERCAQSLESNAQKIEMLFDNLDNISLYLADNIDIINFLNLRSSEIGDYSTTIRKAQNHLPAMKLGNSDILNIQIYAGQSGVMIDCHTSIIELERYYDKFFSLEDVDIDQFRAEYLEQKDIVDYRQNTMMLKGNVQDVFVYNKLVTGINIGQKNNRIVYYLKNDIFGVAHDGEFGDRAFVCFADEEGNLIACNHVDEEITTQIPFDKFTDKRGYIIQKIGGQKVFLTYYRSVQRNWICVEGIPLSDVLHITDFFRQAMTFLTLLAMFVGIVFAILVAKRLSKPIAEIGDILGVNIPLDDFVNEVGQIVKSNTELNEKMKQQVTIMKTEAFYQLFTGGGGEDENIREKLDKIQIRQDAKVYSVLLLNCNDIGEDIGIEEVGAQKVFIEEMISKQNISELQDIYQIDFERMIILLASDDDSTSKMKELSDRLGETLICELSSRGGYSVSVSGDIINDALKIPKAFIHVQKAQNFPKNVCGTGKIQWYDKVKRYKEIEQYDLVACKSENVSIQNQVLVNKVKEYVLVNYNNPQLSLSMVGEEFYITEVYLSKLFKRATGDNFSKYLEELRIQKARELLESGMRVADAGAAVGYNSSQVFRRAYKRYYGCIPSEHLETLSKGKELI